MTLQEYSEAKAQLENDINLVVDRLIRRFQKDTGTSVTDVCMTFVHSHPLGGVPVAFVDQVRVSTSV